MTGVPGTSLHVADPAPHNESIELVSARKFFMGRYSMHSVSQTPPTLLSAAAVMGAGA